MSCNYFTENTWSVCFIYFDACPRNYKIYYRPKRKFAKVMFLHVSVCPQGGVPPGTRYTPQGVPGPGEYTQVHPQTTYTTPGPGTPPQDQVHPPGTRYTPLDQVPPGPGTPPRDQVYIPLEPGTQPIGTWSGRYTQVHTPQIRYTPQNRYTPTG